MVNVNERPTKYISPTLKEAQAAAQKFYGQSTEASNLYYMYRLNRTMPEANPWNYDHATPEWVNKSWVGDRLSIGMKCRLPR